MSTGTEHVLIYMAIFFLAALVHGSVGIGFPIIATPLLALFTDMQTAILLTLVPTLLVNIVSIKSEGAFRHALRRFYPLALLTMLGSLIGTEILIQVHSDVFKLLLAAAIFAYLYVNNRNLAISWVSALPRVSMFVFGLGAGLLGGLTNVMAPLLVIYFIESKRPRTEFIQAVNLCFLSGKLIQLTTFSLHQRFSSREIAISSVMLVVIALALYLATYLKKRIDAATHLKILKVFLFVLALLLCGQYLANLN